jgi:hypothetical protein
VVALVHPSFSAISPKPASGKTKNNKIGGETPIHRCRFRTAVASALTRCSLKRHGLGSSNWSAAKLDPQFASPGPPS